MRAELLSVCQAAPDRAMNEDLALTGANWIAVLDGATASPGVDSGCRHSVTWLVRRLGAELARSLSTSEHSLADQLSEAIAAVRAQHGGGCDLRNRSSPSSTVSLLRWGPEWTDYLVLADSPILLDTGHGVVLVHDDQIDHLPEYTVAAVESSRNRPGGFWVASTDPSAAYRGVTGRVATRDLRRAAVLTDGVGRWVDRFGLGDWAELLESLDKRGPAEVIDEVRIAEYAADPERRGKRHDDATAVVLRVH
ncbi:hypothetical protein D5S17_15570 [Pseudonocardiaceae bacterium YIM PH 21723]|nr:hypothetical protein D5S17_15570 [Pseudonocardiaceae bacterium YIM PH 21723]